MKLIITEKPSVGTNIAKVLGVKERKDGYIICNGYIVSWCVGHLVGLAQAEHYNESYASWNIKDLPIIPDDFKYVGNQDKKDQLKLLCKLINQTDVTSIINACDSGREGELIFRLVYNFSKTEKDVERLWISSLEDTAIREGMNNLRKGEEFDNLYKSALCRQQADWIVGINATRLFSSLYLKTLNVGRVMSPTLAMIVGRDNEIEFFKSKSFYTLAIEHKGVEFLSKRFENKTKAEELLIESSTLVVDSIDVNEKRKKAPMLYDLTSLQREANRMLGYTAEQTLSYVQSLYEKKLSTYPRTDSKFLTNDMMKTLEEVVFIAKDKLGFSNLVKVSDFSKVIDNSKVTDHHAIIPTKMVDNFDMSSLSKGEKEILELIMTRVVVSVSNDFVYNETVVTAKFGSESLTTKGKAIVELGYKEFLGKEEIENTLPLYGCGEYLENARSIIKEGMTTPPKQYTEDTLLSAMDKQCLEEGNKTFFGLGTPATRSGIIEKLVTKGFIERKGENKTKYLVPTKVAINLIAILPEEITSTMLTADWEEKLKSVELGKYEDKAFMQEIVNLVTSLVKQYEKAKGTEDLFLEDKKILGKCPRCGSSIIEMNKTFSCISTQCSFVFWKKSKFLDCFKKEMTEKMCIELLADGKTEMKGCFNGKTGKKYDTTLTVTDDGDRISYGLERKQKNSDK